MIENKSPGFVEPIGVWLGLAPPLSQTFPDKFQVNVKQTCQLPLSDWA